jgi:hypothetical protein
MGRNVKAREDIFFIGSPIDISVAAIYNNPTTGVQTWATKNATTFKISALTATDFDSDTLTDAEEETSEDDNLPWVDPKQIAPAPETTGERESTAMRYTLQKEFLSLIEK